MCRKAKNCIELISHNPDVSTLDEPLSIKVCNITVNIYIYIYHICSKLV